MSSALLPHHIEIRQKIIQKFNEWKQPIIDNINKPLDENQKDNAKQAINEYYKHVQEVDSAYGKAAYDVVNNIGAFW